MPAELKLDDDGKAIGLDCAKAILERQSDLTLRLTVAGTGNGVSFEGCEAGRAVAGLTMGAWKPTSHAPAQIAGFLPELTSHSSGRGKEKPASTVRGRVDRVTVTIRQGDAHSLVEWLCHAPSEVIWVELTRRTRTVQVERRREREDLTVEVSRVESTGRDHVALPLSLRTVGNIRFGVVSEKQVTAVTGLVRPGFLAFERGPEGLADSKLRYSIRFALNFLFGCGLTRLGFSEFDSQHRLLRSTIQSAHHSGGGDRERQLALLSPESQSLQIIDCDFCTRFVRAYVESERAYNLDRAVWAMRHSLSAPADMAAAYLGVAFEVLRDGYYSQPSNKSRTRRLEKAVWSPLESALKAAVDSHAITATAKEKVGLSKLRGALHSLNSRSGREKNTLFLNDLRLTTGEVEEAALAARNDAAHGNPFDESNSDTWLATTDALRTLVARVLFSLLDVTPTAYVDYGSSGRNDFPLRAWNQPQQLRVSLR